jgi:Asp-tRNA(Asn)/Glu-tRNA(Gln) amidotransferase C subunit
MRTDTAVNSLPRDAVLANAPRQSDGFFEVQTILGTVAEDPDR